MAASSTTFSTALFVDFDNIFITLKGEDLNRATNFAERVSNWLQWLESEMPVPDGFSGKRRRILLRKCYLNPRNFGNFRHHFVMSAFEVIDCPPLTTRGKTSADIHLVMDMMDALEHPTRFDEFIVFSADADFTPVLLRLRAHNRRIAVLPVGMPSLAYKAAADTLIDTEELLQSIDDADSNSEALLGDIAEAVEKEALQLDGGLSHASLLAVLKNFYEFRRSENWLGFGSGDALAAAICDQSTSLTAVKDATDGSLIIYATAVLDAELTDALRAESKSIKRATVVEFVVEQLSAANTPLNMAMLAGLVQKTFGQEIIRSKWLGHRNFKGLLAEAFDEGELAFSPAAGGELYIPGVQQPSRPDEKDGGKAEWKAYADIYETAAAISSATEVPLLSPAQYTHLFKEIVDEVASNGFTFNTTVENIWVRVSLKGISRHAVAFAIRSIVHNGHDLTSHGQTADSLAVAFVKNTENLCLQAQLEMGAEEKAVISIWVRGNASDSWRENQDR